jgi:Spy/CpxP family protein refolding chaperone
MAGGSMKICAAVLVVLTLASSSFAAQGGRQGRAAVGPVDPGVVSPAEVQRMFDAYALMQAQEQLKIGDEQFTQFLTRYKALQDVRRRTLQERSRVVMEMRRLLNQAQPDEAQIRDRLKTLQDIDARGAADEKKGYEAIDQVLDIRQQAKFRVFEEVMERRKLELVGRARQANRPRNQQ